ncbi:TPA: outer membrane lipoprotein-sorting protein [Candidatus Poribacteria bacterium]|nr:outer membrane lipoprotein-sorting protein [Candidatus Poribacteria bacterium]HIO05323.1 outer membrane lipoprotein-sorting protein [Candidatus Poribacteria bacterium]
MDKLILSLILSVLFFAQTGFEIAEMVDDRLQPEDISSTATMVLTNSKGKTRTSVMRLKSIDGNKKRIIWFLEPKDDKGVAFLKIEHESQESEIRMWLPAFKKVRRIASTKKGDSFMGSDLSYEDLANRNLSENDYERLKDEIVGGNNCYVLKIRPKPEVKSTYSHHVNWVIKKSLVPLKEESYDKRGKLKKVKSFVFEKMLDYYVVREILVKDVQKNHATSIKFDHIQVDAGIDEKLFHEKNLKRLPRN